MTISDKVLIMLQGMELPRSRVYHISKKLLLNGFNPVVVVSKRYESKDNEIGVKEVFLPILPWDFPMRFIFDLLLNSLTTIFIILLENPNIIILSVPDGSPLIPTVLICKLLKKKLIIDIRDEWEKMFETKLRRIGLFIERIIHYVYASAEALTVVTPPLLKKYRSINANTFLVFNAVDTDLFSPLSTEEVKSIRKLLRLKPEDFVIIYSGRISPPYRIDVILESLKILKEMGDNEVKLLIIGKSGHKHGEKITMKDLYTLARKLNVEDRVRFMTFIPQHELINYLRSSDAGLIPFDENPMWKRALPNKFFEYCAVGLPIVATAYHDSFLAYLINKYGVGTIASPLNYKELAKAISKMKSNRQLLNKMKINARKLAVIFFNSDREYSKFVSIIKKIILEKGTRRSKTGLKT